MAVSQYGSVRPGKQPHPKVPPPVMTYQTGSRTPDLRPLLTLRPKSNRGRARVLKPDVKQALQVMNREIHQRLKACRGQNRLEHALLPSMELSHEIGPILEMPSDAGASSPERCGTGQSGHSPQAGAQTVPAGEVSWRQRLRSRGWRLPERSWAPRKPAQDSAQAEALNATLKLNRKETPESSSARSAAPPTEPGKEETRPTRSAPRVRRRASARRASEDILFVPLEESDGSNPPSRRPSGAEGNLRPAHSRARHRLSHASGFRRTDASERRSASTRSGDPEVAEEDADDKKEPDDSSAAGRVAPDRTGPGQTPQLQVLGMEIEIKEVDITFQVVKWSTQRPESPAADLEKSSGWWETATGVVEHQFVVLQTQNKEPKKVHALELSLPGNDAGPRCCKLQYSSESCEGPWKDAWSFSVAGKSDVKCRTTFETGSTLTKDFKEWLSRTYRGNATEGWRHLFSDSEKQISCNDFLSALSRIKHQMFNPSNPAPSWCSSEASKLCEDLLPKDGVVTLASVLEPPVPPPEAPYWKLTIISNWGSPKRLQVMSPLRLTTLIQVQTGGLSRMRASFIQNQAGSLAGDSLIRAFDLETLGVDSEAVQLRRLAKKYGLSILDVEDMHRLFSNTTSDGKVIVQSEFISMLLKLYGTDDLSEVLPQRLRFFWQQADQDGSGEIDFEEFIMWYNCYCEEILSRRKTRRRRESVEEEGRYSPPA